MIVVFHRKARQEALGAAEWYEQRRPGYGAAFMAELQQLIRRVEHFPVAHPVIRGDYRRASLLRFPYTLVFRARGDELLVVAVLHQSRSLDALAERLS